ncbi:MAG: hypothetical protein JWP97_4012 [Labilithrix sp.]|nr:hypothetical protein [Labilithrix sp.]
MIWDRIVTPANALVACALVTLTAACGSSVPAPTQPLADAQAADRSAQELGAESDPAAKLHLKLAEEQTASAKKLMADGDNEKATALLARAKADAELAVSLAKEQNAKKQVQEASTKANLTTQANQPAQATPMNNTAPGATGAGK